MAFGCPGKFASQGSDPVRVGMSEKNRHGSPSAGRFRERLIGPKRHAGKGRSLNSSCRIAGLKRAFLNQHERGEPERKTARRQPEYETEGADRHFLVGDRRGAN